MLTKEIGTLERISPHCAKAAESVACATYVTQRIFVISSLSPNVRCRGGGARTAAVALEAVGINIMDLLQ